MNLAVTLATSLFFLLGTFLLTTVSSAFRRMHKRETKRQLKSLGKLFFYRNIHHYFFPAHEFEGIFFVTICAQNITRFGYGATGLLVLLTLGLIPCPFFPQNQVAWSGAIVIILIFVVLSFLIGEIFPRFLGNRYPEIALKIAAPIASVFMLIAFPIAALFIKLAKTLWHTVYFDTLHEPQGQVKQEIIEMIQDADVGVNLDAIDKQLIESVMAFRERIAREVMVPRVKVFSLSADLSIKEAAKILESEGYSRTPVYRNTVDNIIGVLMYKDIMRKYREFEENGKKEILEASIDTILKGVLYTPETKKISQLLQEFRKKQVHLAIVVDEYGGTEGIVTIEDILEEIVGDIEDEYDEESDLITPESDGSWLVDARTNINDIEEELGLKIPQEGDFDTIGGYIYHRAGTIPSRGFSIYHDDFKLEVVKSNERGIEKVRITPIEPPEKSNPH